MGSPAFKIGFLIATAVLLLVTLVRWYRTPAGHPERAARADTARLFGLVLLGHAGAMIRDTFLPRSPAFLIASVLLVPIVVLAITFAMRLFGAYRRPEMYRAANSAASPLPDFKELQSKIRNAPGQSTDRPDRP